MCTKKERFPEACELLRGSYHSLGMRTRELLCHLTQILEHSNRKLSLKSCLRDRSVNGSRVRFGGR